MKSRPYPSYAFFDLLYSEEQILAGEKPNVDPSMFKDKIVFVGVTASGLYDVFETPFAGGKMPGIQVHAAVADDFLSARFLAPGAWLRARHHGARACPAGGCRQHDAAGVVGERRDPRGARPLRVGRDPTVRRQATGST